MGHGEPPMTVRLEVGIDCRDSRALATSWVQALGYLGTRGDGDPYLDPIPPDDGRPIFLQRVEEAQAVKSRVHLGPLLPRPTRWCTDCWSWEPPPSAPPTAARSTGSGRVVPDPEGNEFCVCRERPSVT